MASTSPRNPAWPWAAAAAAAPAQAPPSVALTFAFRAVAFPMFNLTLGWALALLLAVLSGLAAAAFLWWSVRGGRSPLPALALAAAPWALTLPLALLHLRQAVAMLAGGLPLIALHADAFDLPRVMGLMATWSLGGGLALGCAIAALAWRAGRPRPLDIGLAVASIVPLALLTAWHVVFHPLVPPWLVLGILVLILLGAFYLGLAAAAAGALAPAHRFKLAVGAAFFLAVLAALSIYEAFGMAKLGQALDAVQGGFMSDPTMVDAAGATESIQSDFEALHRFRLIGSLLALLPLIVLALRTPRSTLFARRALLAGAAAALLFLLLLAADAVVEGPRTRMMEAALDGEPLGEALGAEILAPILAPPTGASSPEAAMPIEAPIPPPPPMAEPPGVMGGVEGGLDDGGLEGIPGGVDQFDPAGAIQRPPPAYPPGALEPGTRATVIVRVEIDASGAVSRAVVVRSASSALDDAALEAARATRFRPAVRNGAPVPDTQLLPYNFVVN